jgi:fluoroacetyl-CoA thioesterase
MNSTINITPGMTGTATTVVTREVTVAHFHPEMPEVYGTPFMIYLMEVAASNAIQAHLPAGHTSVGTAVDVQHLAATPVGRTVTAKAKVIAVDGRSVTFAVEAHDGIDRIGAGSHGRAVIDVARFLKGLAEKR